LKTAFQPTAVRGLLAGAVGLLFSLAVLGSCTPADTGPPRTAAEELMRALCVGDSDRVAEVAPALAAAGGHADLEAIFAAVAEFTDWSIEEVSRDGARAVATVTLSAEGQTARIIVPLRLEDGRWLVEERISVTTTLDFVPLE
jgi:hypothetical protein